MTNQKNDPLCIFNKKRIKSVYKQDQIIQH